MAFIIATIVFSAWLALACTELALRLFNPLGLRERASWHFLLWEGLQPSSDPELVWEHRPGYARQLVGYDVQINSLGFRSDEINVPKDPGTWRMLAIGDSMTFGMSGAQDDAYPQQLQSLLRTAHPGSSIEVINAGVLGYTTLQEETLVRRREPQLKPDLSVVWWFHNDVQLTGTANPEDQAAELRNLIGIVPHTPARHALHAFYELLPCTMALLRASTVGRQARDQSHFQFDPAANSAGWEANLASLRRMIEFHRQENCPLLVYSFGRYAPIAELCRETDSPYVTTVERAGREHETAYAVASTDPHFNRAGNARVAQSIFEWIELHQPPAAASSTLKPEIAPRPAR